MANRPLPGLAFCALLLAAAVVWIPPAAAASSTAWSSTSNFDAGTKEQPTVARNWFATNGLSQPNNEINYPSAEFSNGRTYITWQGPDSAGATHHPSPWITYYDHASASWGPTVRIADATALTDDDHGAPALLVDASGYIHVFYGAHAKPLKHAKSNSPQDISSWTVGTDAVGDLFTYPHPILVGTDIYVIGRKNPVVNQGGNEIYVKSTDGGSTWGSENIMLNVDATNGTYTGAIDKSSTKIYMEWATSERKHAYVAYLDTATGHMFCKAAVSDVDLGTDVSQAEADANCKVEDSGAKNSEFGSVHLDGSGVPYVMYPMQNGGGTTWNHRFSRWTGSAWAAPVTVTVAKNIRNYVDFVVNSATSIEAYLTASGFTGPGPPPDTTDRGGDIEKWTWDGATWTKAATVLYERQGAFTLNNAQIVRNFNAGLKVVFCQTYIDNYGQDVSGILKLFAYDGTNFVQKPEAMGTYAVETTTDDSQVAVGGIELASGKGDEFQFEDTDGFTSRWHVGRWLGSADDDGGRPQLDIASVVAGQLHLRVSTGATAAAPYNGVISESTVSGDFDVQVYPDHIGTETGIFYLQVLNEDLVIHSGSATVDGVQYNIFWQSSSGGDRRFGALRVTDGVQTQVGSTTQFTGANSFARNIRITRVGNTLSWYYNATGSQSWTQDETTSFTFTGASRIVMAITTNPSRTLEWQADNYKLVSTVLDAGGYRTSGSWTSPAVSVLGTPLLPRLTLNVSALTNTYAVDRVEVLQGGVVMQTWEADVTVGTTDDLIGTVPVLGSVSVRVTLKGDGAGTPVLEAVKLDLNPASGYYAWWQPQPVSSAGLLCGLAGSAVFVIVLGVVRIRRRRRRRR